MLTLKKTFFLFLIYIFSLNTYATNPFTQALQHNNLLSTEAQQYLPMDDAFHLAVELTEKNQLLLKWHVAEGYYLFKNSIQVTSDTLNLIMPNLPKGEAKYDEILGHYQVYLNQLIVPIEIATHVSDKDIITIAYQGCAKAGFCYPPVTKRWQVELINRSVSLMATDTTPTNSVTYTAPTNESETLQISHFFDNYSFLAVLGLFLGLGLLLSFTPCVLPMIPILSAILVGQGNTLTRQKAFSLSLIYLLSTSGTYAIAGILTAFLGNSVQGILQTPLVILFTAGILIALAGSLFGFYELRLPSRWEQKIQQLSAKQKGGTLFGVMVMGILSALVVSPCITAPLLGALTYIANTGNMVLGGLTLFFLGIGMGLPLFLVGTFGLSLLPKAGRWMVWIQYFFGVLLIALALSLIVRLVPTNTLSNYFPVWVSSVPAETPHTLITSTETLAKALAQARENNKPVMVDFYADWCVSCIEMEHKVLQKPEVAKLLEQFEVLRIDVTKATPNNQALQSQLGVFAPPVFLFFDKNGKEMKNLQAVGEVSSEKFKSTLEEVLK